MFNFRKGQSLLSRYRNDEGGNISLMFAVSAVAVVGCMGAAMDFSTRSNAKNHSQSIADQIALAAAIYVKDNDTPPKDKNLGYTPGIHKASDLGFDYKGWVDGGAAGVNVEINYDDQAKEATVTVSGATVPTFMQVLGQHDMKFAASSTVSYMQVDDLQPASVIMVLDNSGSMRWDTKKLSDSGERPANPKSRITGLKQAVKKFRTDLEARIGDQHSSSGHRVLRTGILPYNSEIIDYVSNHKMSWGFAGVSDTFVDKMTAEGSTNSNPPMARALEWLEDEEAAHKKEAEDHNMLVVDPIEFVLFMTDGQNTSGDREFVEDDTTGVWYREAPEGTCRRKCWYYRYSPASGFKEGKIQLDSDRKTIQSCKEMKAKGTRIFTLGYALTVGEYYDPLLPDQPGQVTESTHHTAYALLSSCASKPENFIKVGSGDSLQGAFDQISNAIVEEVIRIKS